MDYKQFDKLFRYIGNEKYIYIIHKNNKCTKDINTLKLIISKVLSIDNSDYFMADIIFNSPKYISIHNCSNKKKYNSLFVKRNVLEKVLSDLNISLIDTINSNLVFPKTRESFLEQRNRLKEKMTSPSKNKERNSLTYSKYGVPIKNRIRLTSNCEIDDSFKTWINRNSKELIKKATKSEVYVAKRLIKAFGNKVKVQQPFVINGKCYYADICIKSKKIIIEVDGGYHNELAQISRDSDRDKAFKSIGYETIRIKNEDASSKDKISELIKTINSK